MKLKTLLGSVIATFVLFTSCDKMMGPTIVITGQGGGTPYSYVVPQNANGEYGIVFGGYTPATKATATSVLSNGYDNFELFAWNSLNDTIMKPYSVVANTNGYDYTTVSGQELQYYKAKADDYKFIGIIPANKDSLSIKDGVVTVQNVKSFTANDERVSGTLVADSPDEFLTATKTVAKAAYGQVATLDFVHQNALIYLKFTSDDADTKILDFFPGTSSEYTVYSSAFVQVSAGNDVTSLNISQAEIDEINDNYGWELISGGTWYMDVTNPNKPLGGVMKKTSITTSVYDAIVAKWSSLATAKNDANLNFEPYYTGASYTPIRMGVVDGGTQINNSIAGTAGDGKKYLVIWSVRNSSIATGETKTISKGNIPGALAYAVDAGDEGKNVKVNRTLKADALVSLSGVSYTNNKVAKDSVVFTVPGVVGTAVVASPTTFYMLPCDAGIDGYVIKFSYEYKGKKKYDARVLLNGTFEAGKYYQYTIHITSSANGEDDPQDVDPDDVNTEKNKVISVNANFSKYGKGVETDVTI